MLGKREGEDLTGGEKSLAEGHCDSSKQWRGEEGVVYGDRGGQGAAVVQGKGPRGIVPSGPLARAGAGGEGLLQTLRDVVPMGTWDSAERYPRWCLLRGIWAVLPFGLFWQEGER